MEYTQEQIKAAYALNLCTVSVSQIIDYADVNIMEQEYEAILNNLNLEQMPKDEALLNILKQIMDTITFFRIQEGDKHFIEKEYQQKMKNAIWSAVPNIGMIVAGGSPVTMAVSLASQVGIGYMNYRRAKADGLLDKEKQRWQLERAAIEQFNGLRRELFDTAWRLSAEYNFPDQLRLTERQIRQYNDILMDNDLIRKYERLEAIQDSFIAYPPFWYQMGNTANALSRSDYTLLSSENRRYYSSQAKEHLIQYRESNQHGLLREDPVSSACALELIDLLDVNDDRKLITELLDEAISFSGRRNDILQLVAVGYLKLGEIEKAGEFLRQLVNEQFNTNLNAQLLSSIYVSNYIETQSPLARTRYNILCNRVGKSFLYPMPETRWERTDAIENRFLNQQRKVLYEKYSLVLRKFAEKYIVKYGKLIPSPEATKQYPDSYFQNTEHALQIRKYDMVKVFSSKRSTDYKYRLQDAELPFQILELLNELFEMVCNLDAVNEEGQDVLADCIEASFVLQRDKLNDFQAKLLENKFSLADMEQLLDMHFGLFSKDFFVKLGNMVRDYISTRTELQDFALAEQNLIAFCNKASLPDPSILYGKEGNEMEIDEKDNSRRFDTRLLRGDSNSRPKRNSSATDMIAKIRMSAKTIVLDQNQIDFYTEEDPRVERYFNNNSRLQKNGQLKAQVLAILDDKNQKGDYDLLFTTYGIVPIKSGTVKNTVPYSDIHWANGKPNVLIIDGQFTNTALDMNKLRELISSLTLNAKPLPSSGDSAIFKLPEIKFPFGKK